MAQSENQTNRATSFVFNRTFDAPREDVWNAFTQPEHLQHWWGAPGSSVEIVEHDLKPGGRFHYRMKFPDGRLMWARFIFREIVAPERLVWFNGFSDERGGLTRNPWAPHFPLETLNTVTFAEVNGKTLLTITVVPFEASLDEVSIFAGGLASMQKGFGASFNLLADYLARHAPTP